MPVTCMFAVSTNTHLVGDHKVKMADHQMSYMVTTSRPSHGGPTVCEVSAPDNQQEAEFWRNEGDKWFSLPAGFVVELTAEQAAAERAFLHAAFEKDDHRARKMREHYTADRLRYRANSQRFLRPLGKANPDLTARRLRSATTEQNRRAGTTRHRARPVAATTVPAPVALVATPLAAAATPVNTAAFHTAPAPWSFPVATAGATALPNWPPLDGTTILDAATSFAASTSGNATTAFGTELSFSSASSFPVAGDPTQFPWVPVDDAAAFDAIGRFRPVAQETAPHFPTLDFTDVDMTAFDPAFNFSPAASFPVADDLAHLSCAPADDGVALINLAYTNLVREGMVTEDDPPAAAAPFATTDDASTPAYLEYIDGLIKAGQILDLPGVFDV